MFEFEISIVNIENDESISRDGSTDTLMALDGEMLRKFYSLIDEAYDKWAAVDADDV